MKKFVRLALLAALIALPPYLLAQNEAKTPVASASHGDQPSASEREYIKLSFTLSELDEHGKAINTRRFEAITYADPNGRGDGEISMYDDVPVIEKNGDVTHTVSLSNLIQFSRLYANDENHVSMMVKANMKSIMPSASEQHPISRMNSWNGNVLMPIGERKVIFTSDDLASKHTLQLDLLVTRVR